MSLVDIAPLPTAQNSVIHLHPKDNIAVARANLTAGSVIEVDGESITLADDVPMGHKVAVRHIDEDGRIYRYGQDMGHARTHIEAGQWVHTHNVQFGELTFAYEFPTDE